MIKRLRRPTLILTFVALIDGVQIFLDGYLLCQATMQAEAPSTSGSEKRLWGGRFTGKVDPLMEQFNDSLPFDKRMWREDLQVCALLTLPQQLQALYGSLNIELCL